jgi:hypothetical protein
VQDDDDHTGSGRAPLPETDRPVEDKRTVHGSCQRPCIRLRLSPMRYQTGSKGSARSKLQVSRSWPYPRSRAKWKAVAGRTHPPHQSLLLARPSLSWSDNRKQPRLTYMSLPSTLKYFVYAVLVWSKFFLWSFSCWSVKHVHLLLVRASANKLEDQASDKYSGSSGTRFQR